MAFTLGIPLVELFESSAQQTSALPANVQAFVNRFSVINHTSTSSNSAIFHHGLVQPLRDVINQSVDDLKLGDNILKLPGIDTGVAFQLSFGREQTIDDLEPASTNWRLDLVLESFELVLPFLYPAIYVPDEGTNPRHLKPDPNRSRVSISGSVVLRIEKPSQNSGVIVRLVDKPDPLDPFAQTGFVARVAFSPPHFFIKGSEFGFTIIDVLYDRSEQHTPAEIVERGQNNSWMGFLINEATFYAPRGCPIIGDLSAGVRDFIIGEPLGFQGEFELQFGRTNIEPDKFLFEQTLDGVVNTLTIDEENKTFIVTMIGAQNQSIAIAAGINPNGLPKVLSDGTSQDWSAQWKWPESKVEDSSSSRGNIRHGETLTVIPYEHIEKDGVTVSKTLPELKFRFVVTGSAPNINAQHGGSIFTNALHISGSISDIESLTLIAVSNPPSLDSSSTFSWSIEGQPDTVSGVNYTPVLNDLQGQQILTLEQVLPETDGKPDKRYTRIVLEISTHEQLFIGCETGVFKASDASTALALTSVENSYNLSDFHAQGKFHTCLSFADISQNAPFVIVPKDVLAKVVIAPEVIPVLPTDRHVQLLMEFESDDEYAWGEKKPKEIVASRRLTSQVLTQELHAWAAKYPDADFLIVGRCDDLGGQSLNESLAQERAKKARDMLQTLESSDIQNRIFWRGEQNTWDSPTDLNSDANTLEASLKADNLVLAIETDDEVPISAANGWLIKNIHEQHNVWPNTRAAGQSFSINTAENGSINLERERARFRRVDIYAVGGTPVPESTEIPDDDISLDPQLRRSLVPNSAKDIVPTPSSSPDIDYRVKLKFVWDSPSVASFADAIPTLAEFELVLGEQEPDMMLNGKEVEFSREVFTIMGQWLHDARTGYTQLTIGLATDGDPDGLFDIKNDELTAAMAFGPMLLSGVDLENDMYSGGARIAALAGLTVFAKHLFAPESRTIVTAISLQTAIKSFTFSAFVDAAQYKVIVDYISELHVNAPVLGLKTSEGKPVKILYKKVGFAVDVGNQGLENVALIYDSTSMEILDPGKWEIDGVLGELLRITEVAMGRGSVWVEATLAIGIEIGVIEITEATLRLVYKDEKLTELPSFELRGFALKLDIPNTIKGEGRLRIEDGGVIRAGIECSIIPVGLAANAALAMSNQSDPHPYMFFNLSLGVQFATPMPLGQSGAAIYGFKGLFTMNGERAITDSPDAVRRELEWYNKNPESKYNPKLGQYALGVGVVIGTTPDVSFCFSAEGMLVVGFPDPEVIFGVRVKLLEIPNLVAKDKGDSSSATITGLVVIDDTAVTVAVAGQYNIPKILDVNIPFGAYFPYPSTNKKVYIRLGADNQHERYGDPITLILLPGTLDIKAWAFLMIEQEGLDDLGGNPEFCFDGFAVGFGAGAAVKWSAGPIVLRASIELLVGLGTNPLILRGGIFVDGELSLVVVSVSARGKIEIEFREFIDANNNKTHKMRLDGSFCGKVDMFFFSLEGCVAISLGDSFDLDAPAPISPVAAVSLLDRKDQVMGEMTKSTPQKNPIILAPDPQTGNTASPAQNNTVWPDTVPLIQFTHYIENALPSSCIFQPETTPVSTTWFGSSELKYTYRLDNIILRKRHSDGSKTNFTQVQHSTWNSKHSSRIGDSSGPDDQDTNATINPVHSEHEGPSLKLLDWNAFAWTLNLDNGGEDLAGDPVTTIDDLCNPKTKKPKFQCLFGQDALHTGLYAVLIHMQNPVCGPYRRRFDVEGKSFLEQATNPVTGNALLNLVNLFGATIIPGEVTQLPFAFSHSQSLVLSKGYQLPYVRLQQKQQLIEQSLPFMANYSKALFKPTLTLLVCNLSKPNTDKPENENNGKCLHFNRVKPSLSKRPKFKTEGYTFTCIDPNTTMSFTDLIDQNTSPARRGRDSRAEVRFPSSGIIIVLPETASRVELSIMLFNAAAVTVSAIDEQGRKLDSDQVANIQNSLLSLSVEGSAISRIILEGGASEAILAKICFQSIASSAPFAHPTLSNQMLASTLNIPVVTGHRDDNTHSPWAGEIIEQIRVGNKECSIIRYKADQKSPWTGFHITPLRQNIITIISTCGTAYEAIQAQRQDREVRQTMAQTISDAAQVAATSPELLREIILEPNSIYELEVQWSWQSWQKSEQQKEPPETTDGVWETGKEDVYLFQTADDLTGIPDANGEEQQQDGLNEYIFDVRDVARYIEAVEPADKELFHFTKDSLWIHFEVAHLEQLLEQYDRKLRLLVQRTDPSPQSGADLSQVLKPLPVNTRYVSLNQSFQAKAYQRINQAIIEAPCLPSKGPLGGLSLEASLELEANASYDLILSSSKTDGSDVVDIFRSHFHSSRYADPSALLDSLGYSIANSHAYQPDDYILDTNVNHWVGGFVAGDAMLDQALADVGASTLPLPQERSVNTLFWRQVNESWEICGLLVDSLESLKRQHSVLVLEQNENGEEVIESKSQTRFKLKQAKVVGITPTMNVYRANQAWTRVLLTFDTPQQVPENIVSGLILECETGDSEILSAQRHLSTRPITIDKEVF
ncbi:hypothetical protein DBZ36_05220 [Alginatibacterium sediminis]|uniref:OmpA-like domain-containing protein n=1 Tax=Alginatibacterium sediminis TaxID=2164068 RepID=A0A420EGS1_9ALTE|nr:hypothetical protein [Alginatibacterium sediminis]RKF19860.1 hypothetical protein DBZ36_05220 [Alginatibacterium sediminis]